MERRVAGTWAEVKRNTGWSHQGVSFRFSPGVIHHAGISRDEALAALGTSDAAIGVDNSACGDGRDQQQSASQLAMAAAVSVIVAVDDLRHGRFTVSDSEATTRLFALRLPQPSMPNPPHSPIDCFFSLSRDDAVAAARCIARQILTGSEGIVRRRRVSFERSGFGGRLVQESFVIPELWPLAGPRHSKVQGPSAPMASVTKIDVPSQSSDPTNLSRPDRSSSTTTKFCWEHPPPGRSVALQRDGLFLQAAFYPVPRPMRLDKTEPRGLASSQEPQLRFIDGLPRPSLLLVLRGVY
ncbi:hypothetical protein CSOJ01_06573 [Colletotrichum sojae]|uniref:Uncharacterized protein n=1 Tax=Colletotrichum sojae TaxID=2175907 RepID=A0A8H6MVR5_9PEZI|nr:hypothetical protein CSOJ01_06573 [Colletotrichum sojae]